MRVLGQLGLIFAFGFAGDVAARLLPFGLPASVLGLLLLLAALHFKVMKPDAIGESGNFLASNMTIFFVPPAVGILNSYGLIKPALFKLVFVCVVTTVLTFLAAYAATSLTQRLMKK